MEQHFKPQLEYNLPLSGGVTMPITMPSFNGAQFSLFNVNLGGSGDPTMERAMLDHVGSYGRQIGWLCDAIEVLFKKADGGKLDKDDHAAIEAFQKMAEAIRYRKSVHKK
jgi:hypothetical protein